MSGLQVRVQERNVFPGRIDAGGSGDWIKHAREAQTTTGHLGVHIRHMKSLPVGP